MLPLAFRLSKGVTSTLAPPIPLAASWASRYTPTPSKPLLNLSQGVPGIPPPDFLREALSERAKDIRGFGYGPVGGDSELRKVVAEEMKWIYGGRKVGEKVAEVEKVEVDIGPEDVVITAGCNLAFVATVMCLAEKGDEVILPVPWYFNHQMTLNLLGINTVALHTLPQDGYQPSVERCAELITEKTRAICLVTPNNPTGATYPPSLIASFASLAQKHNIALVLDETYRDFVPTSSPPHNLFSIPPSKPTPAPAPQLPPQPSTLSQIPLSPFSSPLFSRPLSSPTPATQNIGPWRPNVISLYSFSKSYCIPGHRLGSITASPTFLQEVTTVLDCLQICAPRPTQLALASLINDTRMRGFVSENREALERRHEIFRTSLPKPWKIISQGGYFAFIRHPFTGIEAEVVCKRFAEEFGVVMLPASFFCEGDVGAKEEEGRYVRVSVANVGDEGIREACVRIGEASKGCGWEMEKEREGRGSGFRWQIIR
ncbi:hypothetical protein JAAARDRAFT_140546 [Jaapia argillacea MUCL 33604]|uniref:Aminotransferase class I/classII large domain-containing protein n=1 Tax=Jaapia argillacea MUCL 33604 TaxID=933084 RepID=A0A067PL94_9AGAM|nr:hypothetical protein JAAARDRAFT_140546 [Jaapia argillacea MUCL 33604]